MLSFKHYLNESGKLYRIDDQPIIPKAHTYAFSPDNEGSGNIEKWNPPSDWQKRTGLFSGQYHQVLAYAVPRQTRWLVTGKRTKTEKPTIHFSESDREAIEKHRPQISQYNIRQGFTRLPTGFEYFAQGDTAPNPISRKIIENPLEHIQKHYNVKFVKDLDDTRKDFLARRVYHNAEGHFED